MRSQLPLGFSPADGFHRRDFVVSGPNLDAFTRLEAWPGREGGAIALIGPPASGKSYLAALWAQRVGAHVQQGAASTAESLAGSSPFVVSEDVDKGFDAAALFHMINRGMRPGAGLLLTAQTAPSHWPTALPDLRSRLNAMPVLRLDEPDEAILEGMLQKAFRARRIRPPQELLSYLVLRLERSARAAEAAVEQLDREASAKNRPVSRALAIRLFGESSASP